MNTCEQTERKQTEAQGKPLRVIFVEDSKVDADYLAFLLKNEGFTLARKRVDTAEALEQALKNTTWDLIISDYRMPHLSCEEALELVRRTDPNIPFVIVSGAVGEEVAVELMKAGANDFISKTNLSRLVPAIKRELREAQDRQERKRVEKALHTSEAQLSNALKMAHAGHWEYDVGSDTFTFNDNFYRIFRTTAEKVGGYKMSSADYARRFCHPDDASIVRKEIQAAMETTDPNFNRQIEHRIFYADGKVGHMAVRFFIVKDRQGRTVRTYGVNQDITQRKWAESEIKSLAKFPTENPNPILRIARDGKLLYMNEAGLDRLLDWHLRIGQVVPRLFLNAISLVLNTGASKIFDIECQNRLFSFFVAPVLGEGYVNMYGRDITEQKRAEERVRMFSREIMAVREEERKRVSSVLHHDVGSLAVGLSAHLDAIEEDVRSGRPGKALKWMKRTRKLFEQSVARLKSVAIELRPPELDVLGLVAALRYHFSQVTKRGNVRIHLTETLGKRRVPDDIATVVFRIVQEVLTNAIKHGHAKKVDVRLSASKKEISLTVCNDGKSFHPDRRRGKGSSHLGLHMMEEMAASVEGVFTVDSAPGKGTTVNVRLPIEKTSCPAKLKQTADSRQQTAEEVISDQ